MISVQVLLWANPRFEVMRKFLSIILTLTASVWSCAAKKAPILDERSTVMKIEFKRTGGFSPITNASGVVEFKDDAAEVSSPGGSYRRSLSADEASTLRSASSPQNFTAEDAGASSDQVRDGFNYQITITTSDGKQHVFDSNELQKLPAEGAHVLTWVRQESQRILAHKAKAG